MTAKGIKAFVLYFYQNLRWYYKTDYKKHYFKNHHKYSNFHSNNEETCFFVCEATWHFDHWNYWSRRMSWTFFFLSCLCFLLGNLIKNDCDRSVKIKLGSERHISKEWFVGMLERHIQRLITYIRPIYVCEGSNWFWSCGVQFILQLHLWKYDLCRRLIRAEPVLHLSL